MGSSGVEGVVMSGWESGLFTLWLLASLTAMYFVILFLLVFLLERFLGILKK
jgi:hypothetical protein